MGTGLLIQPQFGANICLNPQFSTVLPGTHTSAIQQTNVASTTQNTEMPGWRTVTGTGSPDITVTRDTATVLRTGDEASLKFVTTTLGSSVNRVECPLIEGEAPAIDSMIWSARNRTLTFAADVKQSAATASASRIGIITDGTGGTTTYSDYHGANTNVERLLATVTVPSDASFVKLALFVENATPDVNLGNCMAVSSDAALSSLAFVPRLPINVSYFVNNPFSDIAYNTPADTTYHVTGDGTADTDNSYNALRPAWASAVIVRGQVGGTSTISGFLIKPNGGTNDYLQWVLAVSGGVIEYPGLVDLGADGEIQFRVSNTNNTGFLANQHWIGKDL